MSESGRRNAGIEELRRRVKVAHANGNSAEESKLCNLIGNKYSEIGDHNEALNWHRKEQALCENLGDDIGSAIAYRKVGECFCCIGNYQQAIRYQKMHLDISRQKDDHLEEQRALGNLGRTYFIYSQSEIEARKEKKVVDDLVSLSVENYLSSLEVCRNLRTVSVSELAEMKSRLYLNLSHVYEYKSECDLLRARKYTEQALDIAKKVPLVYRCYSELGTLHYKDGHRFIALQCFHEALAVARKLSDRHREVDTLNKIVQVHLDLAQFEKCMTRLRDIKSIKIKGKKFQSEEQKLDDVQHILELSLEVKEVNAEESIDDAHKKASLLEELGDSCCKLKAYPPALKFYEKQLWLAENWNFEPKYLSPIYVSLAATHADCKQYSLALQYYSKELQLQSGNAGEECDTWYNMAKVRARAGQEEEEVLKDYEIAVIYAERAEDPKRKLNVFKSAIKYLNSHKHPAESSWQQKHDEILELHQDLPNEEDSGDDGEDSQWLSQIFSPAPTVLGNELKEMDMTTSKKKSKSAVATRNKSKDSMDPHSSGGDGLCSDEDSSEGESETTSTRSETDSSSDEYHQNEASFSHATKRKRTNSDNSEPRKKKRKRRFTRCTGQLKYMCEVCSREDCGKCVNCLNRSVTKQACCEKPKEKCISYQRSL